MKTWCSAPTLSNVCGSQARKSGMLCRNDMNLIPLVLHRFYGSVAREVAFKEKPKSNRMYELSPQKVTSSLSTRGN